MILSMCLSLTTFRLCPILLPNYLDIEAFRQAERTHWPLPSSRSMPLQNTLIAAVRSCQDDAQRIIVQ